MYEAFYIKKTVLLIKKVCKDLVLFFFLRVLLLFLFENILAANLSRLHGGFFVDFERTLTSNCVCACKQEQVRQGFKCFTHNTLFLMEM